MSPVNLVRLAEQTAPVVQAAKSAGKEVVDYAFGRGVLHVGMLVSVFWIYRVLCVGLGSANPDQTQ